MFGFGSRRLRSTAAAAALMAALIIPAVANADTGGGNATGATVTFGSISLVGKVVANVTVNITCDPLATIDPNTWLPTTTTAGTINDLNVQLLQAQGRTIDVGNGDSFGGAVICDGSTINRIVLPVYAQVSPWRSGGAVGLARAFIVDAFFIGQDGGSTGNVTVKLGGH
jgi:hypothetical protein